MNILTFDIEEWYVEKVFGGGRSFKYHQFDETLHVILDELDILGLKATFFCVGQMAVDFPDVIKGIVCKGHDIGCHSNVHTWLDKMDESILRKDTMEALVALEDVSGQKVTSYRAPAFSITEKNKWAVNVLADCGIECDASIFPAARDFGGYASFPYDVPCKISYQGSTLKEYPIGLMSIFGKRVAYSGGGYFRLIPYWLVNRTMNNKDYSICYFHLADLIHEEHKLLSKEAYESYFKEPGTLKNRLVRYVKSNVGTGDAYGKLVKLLSHHPFVSLKEADGLIEWERMKTFFL
jgi:peptidoglycan/xylan/chitin deacetylase (PgdA/CDA1 family)